MGCNCFELELEETVKSTLDLYEFKAENELAVNAVIEEVYYRYHQDPRDSGDVTTAVTDLSQTLFKYAWLLEELN